MRIVPFAVRLFLACVSALLALASTAHATVIVGPILNPANGHSYYLLETAAWTASEAEAATVGGHLVTINDLAEEQWVYATFSSYQGVSRALWIGLTDAASEGN